MGALCLNQMGDRDMLNDLTLFRAAMTRPGEMTKPQPAGK